MTTASDSVDLIAPQDFQSPIWPFDLGSKSFYFGFRGYSRSHASDPQPNSTPTIFALPRPLTPSYPNHQITQTEHTSNDQQQLTVQTRSQILPGPSNLTTYASRHQSWEHLAMGQPTNRNKESMARELARWEACWRDLVTAEEKLFPRVFGMKRGWL